MKTNESCEKRAYNKGYSRGYNTGSKGAWPDHRPPAPPDQNVAGLAQALRSLRDAADTLLATGDEDDPFLEPLGSAVDFADAELEKIGRWLRDCSTETKANG